MKLSPEALAIEHTPDHVERWPVTDRASWLQRRQADVTASAAGALLGVHEYVTAYSLHLLKAGTIAEDQEETPAMQRGRLLEPVAVELLREKRPTWTIARGRHYYRDSAARMGATPDVFAYDPDRGLGIVQLKNVEPSIYRKKWKVDDWLVEPPLWIAIQALIEMELTGAKWAAVSPLVVSFGLEMPVIDVPAIPGLMDTVRAEIAKFWDRIEAGTPPAPDYAKDGALLGRVYGADNGETLDLTDDNALPALAAEDAELAKAIKVATERRKAIKSEALAKVGAAAYARFQGGAVTAKTVRRGAYEVKASQYRDIRLKLDVA